MSYVQIRYSQDDDRLPPPQNRFFTGRTYLVNFGSNKLEMESLYGDRITRIGNVLRLDSSNGWSLEVVLPYASLFGRFNWTVLKAGSSEWKLNDLSQLTFTLTGCKDVSYKINFFLSIIIFQINHF